MVAAPHQKILDQSNWGGPEQKIKFFWGGEGGGAKFKRRPKRRPKILGDLKF